MIEKRASFPSDGDESVHTAKYDYLKRITFILTSLFHLYVTIYFYSIHSILVFSTFRLKDSSLAGDETNI